MGLHRPVPREHGAWAMLITSFAGGLVLARAWAWEAAAAFAACLAVFLLREPLLIVWRQARVWKHPHPETPAAVRWLAVEGAIAALCGAWLLARLPAAPLLAMGAAAAVLTAVSTLMAGANLQRSLLLQLASAAGLNLGAPLAWLAARGSLSWQPWALAGLLFAYNAAAITVVHFRLELRAARGPESPARSWSTAALAQAALGVVALVCVVCGRPVAAAAPALAAVAHIATLRALVRGQGRRTPLRRVGWTAVALSLAYLSLAIVGLAA